jgi:FkbM family methyltransferase
MILEYIKDLENVGLNFLDLGSSGSLDLKWNPIRGLINLVGFDPNVEECERQNSLISEYRKSLFLPYAVSTSDGIETLYKTRNIFCYSLLKPNKPWLDRFSFHEYFDVLEEAKIHVKAIDQITELSDFNPDIIKIDVQGLELPILQKSDRFLESAFLVETESGFTENYLNESVFSTLSSFMSVNNYLMFDINVNHRIPRNNSFKDFPTGKEQILWAESVWLKDYIGMFEKGNLDLRIFTEEKIKKILIICSLQKCFDYGFELAEFFSKNGLLPQNDLKNLSHFAAWGIEKTENVRDFNKFFNILKNFLNNSYKIVVSSLKMMNMKHWF